MYKRKDVDKNKWNKLPEPKDVVQAIMNSEGFDNGKILIKNNHIYVLSRWTTCSKNPTDWTGEEFII